MANYVIIEGNGSLLYHKPSYFFDFAPLLTTSTGLYRSCAALAHFSGTFDLILFEAVAFEFIVEKI